MRMLRGKRDNEQRMACVDAKILIMALFNLPDLDEQIRRFMNDVMHAYTVV